MTILTWHVSPRSLEELIDHHELPLQVIAQAKKCEVFYQEILWLNVPWRSKAIKIQTQKMQVPPAADVSDNAAVLAHLKGYVQKHVGFLPAMEQEVKETYAQATFIDEDHRREFTQRATEILHSGARLGTIATLYQKITNKRLTQDHWGDLTKRLCVDDYPTLFPLAHALPRKATVILGPTNSGKTYRAVQILKAAKTGAYWGPLRLLALEIQERMTEEGVACSLLTGEERVLVPGAGHVASTIEMMQSDVELETVVIDEVQMLADKDRGWAWTQAIVGCPTKHLVLVGSPDIWEVLKDLLERLGIEHELVKCERLQPLHVEKEPCLIEDAKPGDAFVVFSRKDVFFYQEMLAKRGLSTAIIYGALGPEVRRSEAQRFRSGEAKVLIATDAIGMGLNLPIARIVFTTMEKFDGIEVNAIDPSLVKQIAGRAGRFGQFADGHVTGVDADILAYVRQCLNAKTKVAPQKLSVAPNVAQLSLLAKEMQIAHTSKALVAWRTKLLLSDPTFFAAPMYERVELAIEMEENFPALPFEDIARMSMVPLPRVAEVKQVLFAWMNTLNTARREKTAPAVGWAHPNSAIATLSLVESEQLYHTASIYCWTARSFSNVFTDEPAAQETRTMVADHLIALLRERARSLIGQKNNQRPPSKYRAVA